MNVAEQFASYTKGDKKEHPARNLKKFSWVAYGETHLKLVFEGESYAEVFLEETCMKEPVSCVVLLPHQFRDSGMNPLSFRALNVMETVSLVEYIFYKTGAYAFLYNEFEKKESERRRKIALERLNAMKEQQKQIQEKAEAKAIAQFPALFDGKPVEIAYEPDVLPVEKALRNAIKINRKKGEAGWHREMLRDHNNKVKMVFSDSTSGKRINQLVSPEGRIGSEAEYYMTAAGVNPTDSNNVEFDDFEE